MKSYLFVRVSLEDDKEFVEFLTKHKIIYRELPNTTDRLTYMLEIDSEDSTVLRIKFPYVGVVNLGKVTKQKVRG